MSADEVPAQRDSLPVFDNHHGKPEVWPGLVVDGLVNRPTCFTANDLARLTDRAITDDFRCVEGWIVADQRWEGVPLSTLLANVNASPSARYAAISAADYTVAVPLGASDVEGVLLATRLNGESLPEQHGGPCRLVSVGQACYASIKWVDRIQLTRDMPVETAQQIAMARNRGVSGSTP
jgi:DMSO/TMAO reductase YedYZ molybdopterin-dependent catalytic subunit